MKFAFDIDGTVCNFFDPLRKMIIREFRYDIENSTEYTVKIPGVPDYMISNKINEMISNYGVTFEPLPYSIEYIYKFYECSCNSIRFITSRYNEHRAVTKKWIDLHFPGIEYELIHCRTSDKKNYTGDINYFADDNLKSFSDEFKNSSIKNLYNKAGFIIEHSYNHLDIKNGNTKNLIPVKNLEDMYNVLKDYIVV